MSDLLATFIFCNVCSIFAISFFSFFISFFICFFFSFLAVFVFLSSLLHVILPEFLQCLIHWPRLFAVIAVPYMLFQCSLSSFLFLQPVWMFLIFDTF